jgi:glycolate oxidase
VDGGVVVDMQRMGKIKEIRVEDLYCICEPGVICDDLNKELKSFGFWIPGPSSSNVATIGGMVATNSSGDKALKYGATRDYVMGLEVVLPTGEIVRAGSKTIKNSGGYQFEKFFVGMEGTLGIITEIIMKVIPLPEKKAAAVAVFDSLEKAGQCVSNIIANRILPSGLELMSNVCIRAVNKALNLGLPEVDAILLIEVDGEEAVIKNTIEKVSKICKETGAMSVEFTDDEKRIVQLWKGRKGMIPSLSKLREDFVTVMLADDMSVPISMVPCAVTEFQKISDKYDIIVASYGHAGDGNLHTKVLMDPTKKSHWVQAENAVKEIYDVVLKLDGTVTGEHGIAITKAPFFHKERGPLIPTMKAIKRAMDPNNIMNPHKIMDWEEGFITHVRYKIEGD